MKYLLIVLLLIISSTVGIYYYVQHEVLEAVGLEMGGHDH